MPGRILIIATPPGEAPDWVRHAWIGLELPFQDPKPGGCIGEVLSHKRVYRDGFHVDTETALTILQQANAPATSWWRENVDLAHMVSLVFDPSVCKVLD